MWREQYRDASNLDARTALYRRFAVSDEPPFPEWMFRQLDLPAAARVLELGCGPGSFWSANRDRVPSGWAVMLSDLSPGMVQTARERIAGVNAGFSFAVLDAGAIPFRDRSFDAVVANYMLYHVPDLDGALREVSRVLVTGGRLYASTNGRRHLSELHDAVRRVAGVDMPPVPHETGFNLDGGGDQLGKVFGHVRLLRYESHLEVTEAQPVLDYVASTVTMKAAAGSPALRRHIESAIERDGRYRITQDTGMFVAVKG